MRPFPVLASALLAASLSAPSFAPLEAQEMSCFLRGATADEAMQRPSPLGQLTFALGGEEGKLCYGRPSAKGRKVMGELVPMGQPWRLGANEATALHLPFAAKVGGVQLEPGSYSLYAVPGASEWEFVVNRSVERWGVPINESVQSADVGRFTRPATSTGSAVEQLTFRWEGHGESMGHLIMEWENTRVEIPVEKGM